MQSSTIEPLVTLIQNYQSVLLLQIVKNIFQNCSNIAKTLDTNLLVAQEEGRNLRIAIVGQMKAGKSSFLNALLFPIDVLPKAATPMTAALTRIGYAENHMPKSSFIVLTIGIALIKLLKNIIFNIEQLNSSYPKKHQKVCLKVCLVI